MASSEPIRAAASPRPELCAHCGSALPRIGIVEEEGRAFCCTGCSTVAMLLREQGLERYYQLRGEAESPVATSDARRRDLAWLEPLAASFTPAGVATVMLDVQGIHCSACVWLVEQLFRRQRGAVRVVVDPSIGRLELWARSGFDLRAFVLEIERFGYMLGPSSKTPSVREDALLVRTAVVVALALNAMSFALALYFGLTTGMAATAARVLEASLALAAVAIGAPPILSSAWASLRAHMPSLDVPIALGIVLAGASSALSALAHRDPGYLDTLAVFVALVLVGRWLTERALRRDRDRLLRDPGADGLFARRTDASGTHVVRATSIALGDVLAIGPGEVVPVRGTLAGPSTFSLEWISGESEPHAVGAGETVPAGAVHASDALAYVRADESFATSPLLTLLARPVEARGPHASAFWERVARIYVASVLALATLTFFGWLVATGDALRALDATTALLVVTCPCGLGIATPLAYTLALGALRRRGLFVRRADVLDRVRDVRRVVFDKTGTLTTGRSHLSSLRPLRELATLDRARLIGLARASSHPASAAIARATTNEPSVVLDAVREIVGAGVEGRTGDTMLRLGRADWAAPTAALAPRELVFAIDGRLAAHFSIEETLRDDAGPDLDGLVARGLELRVLSGDAPERVGAIASALHIDAAHAEGGASPQDKVARLAALDRNDTMFIGDGLNDALAISRAFVSGTPSVERPFVPGRADFYFVTPGLGPIRALFEAADRVRSVARANLTIAVGYNAVVVTLAMAGMMRPWLAAIAMPLSSIAVVTMARMRMRTGS